MLEPTLTDFLHNVQGLQHCKLRCWSLGVIPHKVKVLRILNCCPNPLVLPSGRRIPVQRSTPDLGIVLSDHSYEDKTLEHRLKCSKTATKDVAHMVRNSRIFTQAKRLQVYQATAWASATYCLHITGVTPNGLERLYPHYSYQVRFVVDSSSQHTGESNASVLTRLGLRKTFFETDFSASYKDRWIVQAMRNS